ncbi:hypothetical protein [Acinetobacter haemolyticus]|uniref:Uncharacterized protein n=1 Tax=Acinetobacter haemolyticus TaxID=29430 RepID=A0AAJ3D8G7_ACIHA|nr:hypothetical protein [Acinetobacter haemolyticus]NAR73001.1 hypothetical protein [Acinetobacter haemolyticus]
MGNKIAFFETISPRGHVSLNRFLLTSCMSTKKMIVGCSLKDYYSDMDCIYFNDRFLKKNRINHFLISLYYIFKFFIYFKINNYNKVVILSYDKYNIFFINILSVVLNIKVYAFEHNTFPRGENIISDKLFFLSKRIYRLCFLPHMAELCKENNLPSSLLEHPIIVNQGDNEIHDIIKLKSILSKYDRVIFCPSGSSDLKKIEDKIKKYKNYLFVIKSERLAFYDNTLYVKFFNNLGKWMELSDFVYIPVDFDYRVSGFFYESLGYNKKVILSDSLFSKYVSTVFFNYCYSEDGDWSEFSSSINGPLNVKLYNDSIVLKFNSFLI